MIKRVLIIGGGASGLLVLINLCRLANQPIFIEIAEPQEVLGQGLAYSTSDEAHLLNVPAGRMSAFSDQPSHFVSWTGKDKNYFAPRKDYARYLNETFAETKAPNPNVMFVHRKVFTSNISPVSDRWNAYYSDGSFDQYDHVVLAMGHGLPIEIEALKELRNSSRYQADPWRLSSENFQGRLIGIGTGLTFIDFALSHLRNHPENRVIGISRNGLLPEAHLANRAEPLPVPLEVKTSPRTVRQFIEKSADWRAAQDGVRHEFPEIWFKWSETQKNEFIVNHLRWWNVHRHRVSPEIQSEIENVLADGRLTILADEVESITENADSLNLLLKSGAIIRADKVVNCLGYDTWKGESLLARLIESGVTTAGPLGLGIQCNFPSYNVMKNEMESHPNLYALGPILLGERFETTAIPELKVQALEIAREIINRRA